MNSYLHLSFYKHLACIAIIGAIAAGASIASAQSVPPIMTNLMLSPSYVSGGATTTITWVGAYSANGTDMYFSCPVGILITQNGTSFPCNQSVSVGSATGTAAFVFANLTSSQQYVTVKAIPTDSSGTEYPGGAQSSLLLVGPSSAPITGFSASANTVASNAPIVLNWTGTDPLGVAFQFNCNQTLQITSGTSTVPCNAPFNATTTSASGSQTFTFANSSQQPVALTAYVLPITSASSTYDQTRSLSMVITVEPGSWQPTPSVTSFIGPQSVVSGVPFSLSWTTANATGANIEMNCANGIALSTIAGTTTTPASCARLIFNPALAAASSTTFQVVQSGSVNTVTFELLPQNTDGSYSGTAAYSLTLPIVPAGSAQAGTSAASSSLTSASASSVGTPHYVFTRALRRGSRGADVTALQTFLARDPILYPSGLVTGYYGAATERAVELFQEKYEIARAGTAGYGAVGPKTRTALNSAQ